MFQQVYAFTSHLSGFLRRSSEVLVVVCIAATLLPGLPGAQSAKLEGRSVKIGCLVPLTGKARTHRLQRIGGGIAQHARSAAHVSRAKRGVKDRSVKEAKRGV